MVISYKYDFHYYYIVTVITRTYYYCDYSCSYNYRSTIITIRTITASVTAIQSCIGLVQSKLLCLAAPFSRANAVSLSELAPSIPKYSVL